MLYAISRQMKDICVICLIGHVTKKVLFRKQREKGSFLIQVEHYILIPEDIQAELRHHFGAGCRPSVVVVLDKECEKGLLKVDLTESQQEFLKGLNSKLNYVIYIS